MKLKNINKQWDYMPENAFDFVPDDVPVGAVDVYKQLYDYAVALEEEVRIQRSFVRGYLSEVRKLNFALMRKHWKIWCLL